MISAGTLIWISCRPLIRLMICVGCGFGITKADIFPVVAAQGVGQIVLNIALPCLLFSKIVPAFTSDNISALGPLVLVAVLYEAIGICIAWLVKQFFWVPHRFRYGILVAGGWGNCGDLPTAVFLSICGSAPFDGSHDQNLSVAYLSAFLLVFMITLFPFGGHMWIAMDYVGPDVEVDEVQEAMRMKRKALIYGWPRTISRILRRRQSQLSIKADNESGSEKIDTMEEGSNMVYQQPPLHATRHVSFYDDTTTAVPTEGLASPAFSAPPTEAGGKHRLSPVTTNEAPGVISAEAQRPHLHSPAPAFPEKNHNTVSPVTTTPRRRTRLWFKIRACLKSVVSPPSIAILIAFPIALVPQLKALFVDVPGTPIPPAPDGQPPLAFLIDAASFIGGASVPLGLMCLGAALARLNVPRNRWSTLPLGAITWLAIGKIIITPVLGVLICQGLVRAGIIPKEDKVLQFVCIFLSCLPTATTQVYLTQVYSGTGSAEHLSPFLIPQYILMFITMPALTAYTLQLLF